MKLIFALFALFFTRAPGYVCPEPGLWKAPKTRIAVGLSYDQGQGFHIQTRFGRHTAEVGPTGVHSCSRPSDDGSVAEPFCSESTRSPNEAPGCATLDEHEELWGVMLLSFAPTLRIDSSCATCFANSVR